MASIPYTLEYFSQRAIQRKPTLHDVIHYVSWMGYIQETKYYSSTCKEAANNIEFAYANSRATYGKTKCTRLHVVCSNAWDSKYTVEQQNWARTTEDHARWGTIHYEPNSWRRTWTPINVKQAKYDVEWRKSRVQNLMTLAAAYAKNNLADVINQKNTNGYSALHGAVYSGNLELVKLLLDAGAYPEGDLPLLYNDPPSVSEQEAEAAEVIFHHPAPPPHRAKQPAHRSANILQPFLGRKTTMTVAVEQGHSHIVEELIRRGHRLYLSDFRAGPTPIQKAVKANSLLCVKALLDAGVSPKGLIISGTLRKECSPMIQLLIQYGADPNETDTFGRTPLMTVAFLNPRGAYGQPLSHAIKPLVKAGSIIDMRDNLGQTALFLAAARDNADTVKALLDCGANTQIRDDRGTLPIEIADDQQVKTLIARADLKKRFKGQKRTR